MNTGSSGRRSHLQAIVGGFKVPAHSDQVAAVSQSIGHDERLGAEHAADVRAGQEGQHRRFGEHVQHKKSIDQNGNGDQTGNQGQQTEQRGDVRTTRNVRFKAERTEENQKGQARSHVE